MLFLYAVSPVVHSGAAKESLTSQINTTSSGFIQVIEERHLLFCHWFLKREKRRFFISMEWTFDDLLQCSKKGFQLKCWHSVLMQNYWLWKKDTSFIMPHLVFFKADRNLSLWSELLMTYGSVLKKAFSLNADILSYQVVFKGQVHRFILPHSLSPTLTFWRLLTLLVDALVMMLCTEIRGKTSCAQIKKIRLEGRL